MKFSLGLVSALPALAAAFNVSNNVYISGGVLSPDEENLSFSSISADLTVPQITFPRGRIYGLPYSAMVWIGFGSTGATGHCNPARQPTGWKVGIYIDYDASGEKDSIYPFYQTVEDTPQWFGPDDNSDVLPGDTRVHIQVTNYYNGTGVATLRDFARNKEYMQHLNLRGNDTSPVFHSPLCDSEVNWAVEAVPESSYPTYDPVTFENIKVIKANGKVQSLDQTIIMRAVPDLNYNNDTKAISDVVVRPDSNTTTVLFTRGYNFGERNFNPNP